MIREQQCESPRTPPTPSTIQNINSPASFFKHFNSPRKLSAAHTSHADHGDGVFETLKRLLLAPPPAPATVVDVHSVSTVAAVGALLNFNAAYINATVWLLHGHATTHLTGLTTKTAMALAAAQLGAAAEMFVQFSCFVVGAFVTALALGGNDKFEHTPRYALLLAAIGAIVLVAAACDSDTAAVMLATFAAGLQNAMATFYSGAVVRTTHVTGTATDIGIEAAKLLLKGRNAHPTWKLRLLCVFLLGFFAGGCAGAFGAALIPAWSLVVPGASTLTLAVTYLGFLLHDEREKAAVERGKEFDAGVHDGGEKPMNDGGAMLVKSFKGHTVAIDVVLEPANVEEETKQG